MGARGGDAAAAPNDMSDVVAREIVRRVIRARAAGVRMAALALSVACASEDGPGPVLAPLVIDTTAVPPAIIGEPHTFAFNARGGSGTYTWTLSDGALPTGITLSPAGVISGTPTSIEQRAFSVRATSGASSTTRAVQLGVDYPPVTFATGTLPVATWGRAYFTLLQANGGTPGSETAWALASGNLPTGVTLAPSGSLGGIPTALGAHPFRLRATRGTRSAEFDLQLRVDAPALVMETTSLPDARAGQPYVANLLASGGVGGYSWRLVTGVLPGGLTLGTDGTIAGTPAVEDSMSLGVEVTSGAQQVTRTFGLLVEPVTYPATALVTMPGDVFAPFIVRVRPGGTVTWRFGASPHNVIFAPAPNAPANIDIVSNVDVSRTFPVAGAWRYDCTIHPGMAGRVEVR